jgi:signal transduction histidine kinase
MSHEPINILLVDDQPGKLLGYHAILEELGETLLTAHSAREALEMLLKNDVALILIDVNMPELDGFELAEMIREHPRFEKTAMMFVSGVNLSDLDRIRGYTAGAVDYVSVPVVPEILRAKVRVFADLHRKTRQLESLNRELEHRVALRTAELEASTTRWQDSEQRLRMALASARAGAWDLRFDTGEMRWSPELFKLLAMPEGSPVPGLAGPVEFVHPHDRSRVAALIDSLPTAQGPFELEFRVMREPGPYSDVPPHDPDNAEIMWIRITGEVARNAKGEPQIARGILQDVTSRKLAELKLEEEARRKDEFLATLAHELRNPLAPMVAGVRLLRSPGLDSDSRERNLVILERQVTHLARLVDDLLDVSRISRGAITLLREPVDMAELLRASLEASSQHSTGHRVEAQIPRQGPFVQADPVRLAQIVTNILDNALKFTPPGGRIDVRICEDGECAELRIRDTGKGVPPEDLERIFNLFTQVDTGGGRAGLGIGLALVRRLVDLHGGEVWAESEGEGKGTELVVRLPRMTNYQPVMRLDPPTEDSTPLTSSNNGAGKGPLRILIVDDNVDAADTLVELLKLTGHDARAAYNGSSASVLGSGFEPHLVLLDLGMPDMDGFDTARQMRQTAWGSSARLVAVTGWGEPSDRKRTAAAGFDGHLVKPVDFEELLGLSEIPELR